MNTQRNLTCFALLFGLMLLSCQDKKINLEKNTIAFNKFPKQDSVLFNDLFEFKNGVASRLLLADSNLIILNTSFGSKSALYFYSLMDNKLSNGCLHIRKRP